MEKPNIGYIILPAGHGKSHNYLQIPGLVEADSILNCNGTTYLQLLRDNAKRTGNWESYDKEWGTQIRARLTDFNWVVMVPAKEVGEAMGGEFLGSATLYREAWKENLKSRNKKPDDYRWGTIQADAMWIFSTNNVLQDWLLERSAHWITTGDLGY